MNCKKIKKPIPEYGILPNKFKNIHYLLRIAEEFDYQDETKLCNKQLLLLSDYIQEYVKNNKPKIL